MFFLEAIVVFWGRMICSNEVTLVLCCFFFPFKTTASSCEGTSTTCSVCGMLVCNVLLVLLHEMTLVAVSICHVL